MRIVKVMLLSVLVISILISSNTALARNKVALQNNEGGSYILGTGDKIRLTVFEERDLSGEFEVNSDGLIDLPLIGEVKASNFDIQNLETLIVRKLKNGYLVNPKVNIEIIDFRPFFILGEVKNPGSYPYVNSLTVMNAVATAGGYTYRANKNKIIIQRLVNGQQIEIVVGESTRIMPSDTIEIKERLF